MTKREKLIKDLEFRVRVWEERERVFNSFNTNKDLIQTCKSYEFLNDLYEFLIKKWQDMEYQIRANYLYVIDRLINKSVNEIEEINLSKT